MFASPCADCQHPPILLHANYSAFSLCTLLSVGWCMTNRPTASTFVFTEHTCSWHTRPKEALLAAEKEIRKGHTFIFSIEIRFAVDHKELDNVDLPFFCCPMQRCLSICVELFLSWWQSPQGRLLLSLNRSKVFVFFFLLSFFLFLGKP